MGYSVFVTLNKTEQEKVRAFLDFLTAKNIIGAGTANLDGTVKDNALFGRYTSDPRMENLRYAGKYKSGTYVGCDYGIHDIAHTFTNWMAKTLGKAYFIYDGDTKVKVKPDKIIDTNRLLRKRKKYNRKDAEMLARFLKTDKVTTPEEWQIQEDKIAQSRKAYRKALFKLVNTLQREWDKFTQTQT